MTDFFEHIDAYVNGQLNKDDRQNFEEEMARDTDLKKAVDNHSMVSEALELLIEEDIRSIVDQVQESQAKVIPLYKKRWFIFIAATFTILFGAYFGFRAYLESLYGHDQVYADYYEFPKNPYTTRSVEISSTTFERSMYLFDLRRFEESESLFQEILANNSSNDEKEIAALYLGNIYFLQQKYQQSLEYFEMTNDKRKYEVMAQIFYIQGDKEKLTNLNNVHTTDEIRLLIKNSNSWRYNLVK